MRAFYAHERYVVLRSHGHLSPPNAVGVGRVVKVEPLPSLASQERKLRKLEDKGVHSTRDCFTLRGCQCQLRMNKLRGRNTSPTMTHEFISTAVRECSFVCMSPQDREKEVLGTNCGITAVSITRRVSRDSVCVLSMKDCRQASSAPNIQPLLIHVSTASEILTEDFEFRGSLGAELSRRGRVQALCGVRTYFARWLLVRDSRMRRRRRARLCKDAVLGSSRRDVSRLRTHKQASLLDGSGSLRLRERSIKRLWVLGDLAGLDALLEENARSR